MDNILTNPTESAPTLRELLTLSGIESSSEKSKRQARERLRQSFTATSEPVIAIPGIEVTYADFDPETWAPCDGLSLLTVNA